HRLGRDAAAVQAGAAELLLLDERDPAVPPGPQRQREPGHAPTEYEGVVSLRHCVRPPGVVALLWIQLRPVWRGASISDGGPGRTYCRLGAGGVRGPACPAMRLWFRWRRLGARTAGRRGLRPRSGGGS